MERTRRIGAAGLCVLAGGLVAVGCDKGGSGGGARTSLAGPVVAGFVANADVKVFTIRADRTLALAATGTTDTTGVFTLDPPGDGPFLVVAGNGTFVDEATGASKSLAAIPDPLATLDSPRPKTLEAVIGSGSGTSPLSLTLTPLSTFAARRVATASKTDANALTESAVTASSQELATEFGLVDSSGNPVDPRTIVPLDFTSSGDAATIASDPSSPAAKLGALLAGLSQAADDAGLADPLDLVEALAQDAEDGVFNGQDGSGSSIQLGSSGTTLAPDAGTGQLADATQDFLDSPENTSTTTSSDFTDLLDDVSTQDVAPAGVNKAPSFSPIPDQSGVVGFPVAITLSSVSAGSGESQGLTFTTASSDTAVVSTLSVTGSGTTRTLSFTPVGSGPATITVTLKDDGGTANGGVDTAVKTFVVTVLAPAAPSFTSTPVTSAPAGVAYSYTLAATGTPAPVISLSGGTLPSWLSYSSSTRALSGTPAVGDAGSTGTLTFSASNGVAPVATQSFAILVTTVPTITSTAPTSVLAGNAYSYTATATGTPAPTLSFSGLPSWLTAAGDTVSGTPGAINAGQHSFTVTATSAGGTDTQTVTVDVDLAPTITSATPPGLAYEGTGYSHTVTASGHPAPTFSLSGAPAWLTINATSGLLSGTPQNQDQGTASNIVVTASNGIGAVSSQTFSILVEAGPVITSTAPTTAVDGVLYTYTITATGTPTPTISVSGLPGWLSFDNVDTITGTPGTGDVGVPVAITVTADNTTSSAGALSDTQTFQITVDATAPTGSWNATSWDNAVWGN